MSANDTANEQLGQGQEGQGIFDSYLASVPEEQRETVAQYLKDAEKNVNSRYQEAAELKKQYEPFSQIEGLDKYDAQSLSQILAWHQGVQQPDALKQWVQEVAGELGLTFAEAQELQEQEQSGEISTEQIQQLVAQATQPLQQRLEDYENAQQQGQIENEIGETFAQIEAQSKVKLDAAEKGIILDLAASEEFIKEPDWIQKGFERFQQITALGQKQLVSDASQQPAAGLSAGGTPAVEGVTDFKTAGEQAKERLRQARG